MVHLEKTSMTYREESSHLGIRDTKETVLPELTMRRQGNTMQEQAGLQGRIELLVLLKSLLALIGIVIVLIIQ